MEIKVTVELGGSKLTLKATLGETATEADAKNAAKRLTDDLVARMMKTELDADAGEGEDDGQGGGAGDDETD